MTAVPPTAAAMSLPDTELALDLCLRIAEVKLASGVGAAEVAETMRQIAKICQLRFVEVDVTYTSLMVSSRASANSPTVSRHRRVQHRAIDYTALARADEVVDWLRAGRYTLREAWNDATRIPTRRKRITTWQISLLWGVVAAGAGLSFGGNGTVCVLSFAGACTLDILLRWLQRRQLPAFYLQVCGGLFSAVLGIVAVAMGWTNNPSPLITACIIALLAGISFVGAVQDALAGFYVTGSARLLEAFLSTAGIIVGVSGGLSLAQRLGVPLTYTPGQMLQVNPWVAITGASITGTAFAVATHAHRAGWFAVAVLSAVCTGIAHLAHWIGMSATWGAGMSATALGVFGVLWAHQLKLPFQLVAMPPLVPLLPGVAIFRGLASMTDAPSYGVASLFGAAGTGLALAAGLLLGEYFATPVTKRRLWSFRKR